MQTTAAICFWLAISLVAYTYVVYPVLLWLLSRVVHGPIKPGLADDANLPTVTMLIAAYNEAAVIERRIVNALALDYPKLQLKIVVASDGSSDGTAEIVRRYAGEGVRLLDYPGRRGKIAVLKSAVSTVTSDIIVFSDANTDFDLRALRKLIPWFTDRSVGAVCGRLILTDHAEGRNADGVYWRYETLLKRCEGKLGALLGSNGAIYAIRREIFPNVPDDVLVDDFVIPLAAKLQTNCEIIYEPDAVAVEEVAPEISDEFTRRARIGAGGYQSIVLLWPLMDPRRGWIALSFFSHKLLRWLCPFLLIAALMCSLILSGQILYRMAAVAQLAVFGLSIPLSKLTGHGPIMRFLRLCAMFTLMNAALFVGFLRWAGRRRSGVWVRTARSSEADRVVQKS